MSFKILVVDDDIDVLESRKIVLEHNNYEVETATNIMVAEEVLNEEKIDLILLDVMMEKDSWLMKQIPSRRMTACSWWTWKVGRQSC